MEAHATAHLGHSCSEFLFAPDLRINFLFLFLLSLLLLLLSLFFNRFLGLCCRLFYFMSGSGASGS
jgi:hypothetical protein